MISLKSISRSLAVGLLALLTGFPALSRAEESPFHWLSFDATQVSIFQSGGGTSYSGAGTWAPSWKFADSWSTRFDLGAALIKGSSQLFIAPRAQLFVQRSLNETLVAEAGGGFQNWALASAAASSSSSRSGSMVFMGSANVRYRFSEMFEPFAGYSYLSQSGTASHEARLGVGIWL